MLPAIEHWFQRSRKWVNQTKYFFRHFKHLLASVFSLLCMWPRNAFVSGLPISLASFRRPENLLLNVFLIYITFYHEVLVLDSIYLCKTNIVSKEESLLVKKLQYVWTGLHHWLATKSRMYIQKIFRWEYNV